MLSFWLYESESLCSSASIISSSPDLLAFYLQQWVDLARFTGLQTHNKEAVPDQVVDTPDIPLLECSSKKVNEVDESNNQSGDTPT